MFNIEDFIGGSSSARNKLNSMIDELQSLSKIRGDKFINVSKSKAGVNINLNENVILTLINRLRAPLIPVIITAIGNDSLTGRYLYPDGVGGLVSGSVNVTILKPWTLRRTPFDGLTVNGISYIYSDAQIRVADDGENQETQYVTQDYFVNAIIYVREVNEPNADVIDVNVDSRAWCHRVAEE